MRVRCAEQGTRDWLQARKGRVTASAAHRCLMGRHTKGRRLYVEKIADDLEGIPDFDDEEPAPWFTDGRYYESWARGWYAWTRDADVRQVGFVVHDEHDWIGCSPDGLVGFAAVEWAPGVTHLPAVDEGLIEIKYRKTLRSFMDHAQRSFTTAHHAQMQTQMLVTGCRWVDYTNYWRSVEHDLERGHVQRVHRDQTYIDNTLLPGLVSFMDDVREEMARRELQRRRGVGRVSD